MSASSVAALAVACALGAAVITWSVRRAARLVGLLDRPNERSAHATPTPRLGGVGIMGAFLPAAAALAAAAGAPRDAALLAATALIAIVGLVDDLRPLPAALRLAVQFVAATAVVTAAWPDLGATGVLASGLPPPLLAAASVLWIVWVTNVYNFMDGVDGLAGGQAVFACAAIAVVAYAGGAPLSGALAAALGAAVLGFLAFNFPPASIFMGDVGSTAIGFFLASLPFLPSGRGAVPVEAVALALGLFVLDATVTLVGRAVRREPLLAAHRTHHYQRPLAFGVTHRTITLTAYSGMVIAAAAAVSFTQGGGAARVAAVVGVVLLFVACVAAVRRMERQGVHRRGGERRRAA